MSRRALALVALIAASVAVVGGCQSYNFNPVGSCLVQPGQKQVTLEGASAADVLFVVDDSGSMDSKQQALAQNFSEFIGSLATAQADRAAAGLVPFDFHIAVTTSSVFRDYQGQSLLTSFESPLVGPTPGVAIPGAPYPQGNFVAFGSNPKVLHFTKDLTWANCNTGGPCTTACLAAPGGACTPGCTTTGGVTTCTDSRINTLIQQFSGTCFAGGPCSPSCAGSCSSGNIEVGSCGSGEEQHLQAGRLAMQKALAGQQGLAAGEFPHVGAKLVVVWVGDEDDCSNDPANPIVLSGPVGNDTCVNDTANQRYPIADFADYFSGLVAPAGQSPSAAHPYVSLGTAFIVAANRCTASDPTTCAPADSAFVQSPAACTGTAQFACSVAYAAGIRFLQLASDFKSRSFDVIEGTVCEAFGPLLASIADLVKPVTTLQLGSLPAATDITVLRIVDAGGNAVKVCTQRTQAGPVADPAAAQGWWFAGCGDTTAVPAVTPAPTTCIYINHAASQDPVNSCEAQTGQTYSAEYMGRVPAGGCPGATPAPADSLFCAQAAGSPDAGAAEAKAWWCYGPSGSVGTCVCKPE